MSVSTPAGLTGHLVQHAARHVQVAASVAFI